MAPKDPIVQTDAPVLRLVAKPLPTKDFGTMKLKSLIARMSRALAKEKFGVALAAPQIGESLRIFVVAGRVLQESSDKDAEAEKEKEEKEHLPRPQDIIFINPEIIRLSRKTKEMSEGCLSVRGKYGTVIRHEKATVRARDIDGKLFTYHASGLMAHIFQHECDHLDGILYTDKAEQLRNDPEKSSSEDLGAGSEKSSNEDLGAGPVKSGDHGGGRSETSDEE